MTAPSRPAEPRLAAVWFADLCGYSSLAARNEPMALELVELLQQLAGEIVDRRGGRVVKFIGDAVLAEFPSVRGAARAALSLTSSFEQAAAVLAPGTSLRVGLHLGEISEARDGDIYGEGVNVASRLQERAQPGEVLVSGDVWRQLRQLPEFRATHGGARKLRGTATRLPVYVLTSAPVSGGDGEGSGGTRLTDHRQNTPTFPLVGRDTELTVLRQALERLGGGAGGTLLLAGEAGAGKTQLVQTLAAEAEGRAFQVAIGRAYPVESGVPYALIADALLPLVRRLDPATVASLADGGAAELSYLFPALGWAPDRRERAEDAAELKGRLLWTFTQFVSRLGTRVPLLLILDDVHWADASSLELLHFLARQTTQVPVLIVCTYARSGDDGPSRVLSLEQSLLAIGVARLQPVEALTRADIDHLLCSTFNAAPADIAAFSSVLYEWTRGNSFFAREVLGSLIASGRIREVDGRWVGWDAGSGLELPRTVRLAVLERIHAVSAAARAAADAAAVVGTRISYYLLRIVTGLPEDKLLAAIDELRRHGVLTERLENGSVVFDFCHPIARQVLYSELGKARCCRLHGTVAEALERMAEMASGEHVDDLAYHFARAAADQHGPKAARYLAAAGRGALERFANREAADYLAQALRLSAPREPVPASAGDPSANLDEAIRTVIDDLARAHQRLGEYPAAIALLERLIRDAEARGDMAAIAGLRRRIGLDCYWNGQHMDALGHFEAGIHVAHSAAAPAAVARLELARAACYQELGRADDAQRGIEQAHAIAEALDDEPLHARAHRAFLLLHTWIGPADAARRHGARAIELAERTHDPTVSFFSHWALALVEGFTGHIDQMVQHMTESERLAISLRSPLLRLWTDELSIEHAWSMGDWERGITEGERAIALARTLNQRTLLPRLLVWTALIRLARGELETARPVIEEAWTISRAGDSANRALDVHAVVPAHIGRAAYHLASLDFHAAIRTAEAGLAVADRSGYPFWAIHRLLPIICEASLNLRDLDAARRVEKRLRRDSERLGHRLGIAWSDACRALVAWLGGDVQRGAQLLRSAVESLDEIPIVPDAARLRRQLAGRLMELGDRAGALHELRRAFDVFLRLGARPELEKTRLMFAQLGAESPVSDDAPSPPPARIRSHLRRTRF